jgi:hypothetical protein
VAPNTHGYRYLAPARNCGFWYIKVRNMTELLPTSGTLQRLISKVMQMRALRNCKAQASRQVEWYAKAEN